MPQRSIDVSYETVRYWWNRFGPMLAHEIRTKRVERSRTDDLSRPSPRWKLRAHGAAIRRFASPSPGDERHFSNRAENSHKPFDNESGDVATPQGNHSAQVTGAGSSE
jgi:transposase-like protein